MPSAMVLGARCLVAYESKKNQYMSVKEDTDSRAHLDHMAEARLDWTALVC